ncbi:TetR/AcrR family transcriptional regulator [Paenibacillus sp. P96]|uniref:TetR/AcrR family transcriptional regulator n=1 Tax=Paenibacillus zeirhizosphaerae TaxID=2987519 RepID=A0ABT9FMZ9_9BACL|nr:TetR/AcrR family transcriptional regulator [Paenibacillus sp. P96]MDP4096113.1 TetR/AcrR family transcriptional regulator [Paenibacillus sp. P96]
MTANLTNKPRRESAIRKRADILAAARHLFLMEGFNQSSVDAVAAQANVSKRTVYDYFGDKRALLLAVVEETGQAIMTSIEQAVEDKLQEVSDLEQALIAFCEQIMTSTIGSADYAALLRLVTMEAEHLPDSTYDQMDRMPEEALAKRLAEFGKRGWLTVPDAQLAAKHFAALTFLLVLSYPGQERQEEDARNQRLIVEGVRAFLRAYAPEHRE